ncbi:MAG: exopolysaccharide biosynthesis protein [Burkholderiales bacterium]|nr:exopolysaccharide biosynthesis protein [Burkholderiales bacterium]
MPRQPHIPERPSAQRRSAVERIATAHVARMGGTLADTIGDNARQRLVWLGLLAMPLLFPVALPGMATAVGALCVVVAVGLCAGQTVPLPGWLARRELNARAQTLLASMVRRAVRVLARFGRPRLLALSNQPARLLNGLMLSTAGLSMAVPVPMISFDNVLPALAIVLMCWGLRLRDGLMVLAGYVATAAAVASVALLWWGGSVLVTELLSLI